MSSCEFQFNFVARFSADNLNSLSARFLSSLASQISFEPDLIRVPVLQAQVQTLYLSLPPMTRRF